MEQLQRSVLLLPGTLGLDETRATIRDTNADMICLDLEDTVVASEKQTAREAIVGLLSEDIWGRSRRALRINPLSEDAAALDVEYVIGHVPNGVDSLFLSKAETVDELRELDVMIERARGTSATLQPIGYVVGIESAGAMTRVDELATASPNVSTLGLAVGDLSISLGMGLGAYLRDRNAYPGDMYHFHRSRLVLSAKTHGLKTLDFPWPIVPDLATLEDEARRGMMLGMDGKLALAAQQVPVIHQAYAPPVEEVERFKRLIAAYERAAAEGQGATSLDGEFIDPVTLGLARRVLARAQAPI